MSKCPTPPQPHSHLIIPTPPIIRDSRVGEYFPELKSFERRVKVELDLSNYATKAGLKKSRLKI